jgi:hypothetical protein
VRAIAPGPRSTSAPNAPTGGERKTRKIKKSGKEREVQNGQRRDPSPCGPRPLRSPLAHILVPSRLPSKYARPSTSRTTGQRSRFPGRFRARGSAAEAPRNSRSSLRPGPRDRIGTNSRESRALRSYFNYLLRLGSRLGVCFTSAVYHRSTRAAAHSPAVCQSRGVDRRWRARISFGCGRHPIVGVSEGELFGRCGFLEVGRIGGTGAFCGAR